MKIGYSVVIIAVKDIIQIKKNIQKIRISKTNIEKIIHQNTWEARAKQVEKNLN